GVEIFTAQLQIQYVAGVVVTLRQSAAFVHEAFVIRGVNNLLEVAAQDRRRFFVFGNGHGVVSFFAAGDVNVAAFKIHEPCALQKYLGQPRIVVAATGDVAIGAGSCFFGAYCVRNEWAERLPAEAFSRHCLLLVVSPAAIGVLRTYQHRASGSYRRDPVSGDGSVDSQHVQVITQNLKVIRGIVSGGQSFVMQHGHALVGGHLQVAAKTGGQPGGV